MYSLSRSTIISDFITFLCHSLQIVPEIVNFCPFSLSKRIFKLHNCAMESWAYYKALKFIEAYWHECWYIMNSMNFTLETSNYIKLPIIFIGKKAFYFAFEIDQLDTISVNVSFEKYCFVLIIIIRPVSNWNHSWIIMLGCFVDLRLFTEFSLTLNSHLIVLFGSPHNVIRPAIDLFLFIFIKYSGSVGEKALTIKEANLHIGKVNENIYSCIKRHFG